MRKVVVFLNIIAFLLASCGTFNKHIDREPAAVAASCSLIIKDFFREKSEPAEALTTLKNKLKIEITNEEVQDLANEFKNETLSSADNDTLRAIILFSRDDSATRSNLLKEFRFARSGGTVDDTNKTWQKFIAHRKKVETHKSNLIGKENTELGRKAAIEKGLIYEKLYYSCKSQVKGKPSTNAIKQSKRLRYALMAGGVGSVITTYSAVHWNEEKNTKWFKELYYILGVGLVLNYIGGKLILGNPNLNPWKQKMPLTFLNNALNDMGVSGIYAYLFSTGDAEQEKKFKALQADPKANEKLQELIKYAEENGIFQKHQKSTQDLFIDKNTNQAMKSSDFDHEITFDDIDLEESREILMESLAEQEYKEKSGMIATGMPAVDRFSYHRLFNVLSVPTNIGLTIIMQNQMCMTADPKKGFAKAVAIYMGTSIIMDSLYFKGRKEVINQ